MKNTTYLRNLMILVFLVASTSAFAISPSNDCGTGGSQQFTVSTNACNTTAFDFSSNIGSPSLTGTCASGGTQDGWGWFTATGTSTTVTATPAGIFARNISLMIYSGTCGGLTLVTCVNANSSTGAETATFATVNATNYFIRIVRMSGTSFTSDNDVCVRNNVAPAVSGFSPSAGCVGSVITINGTNLSGATNVSIGGTNATILTNSATVITATVGSGSTGTVSVTTGGGTGTSAGTFTVNQLPVLYTVSGGGAYCPGGAGMPVNLSNSESGVDYQLKLGGSNVGSPVSGTGAALAFGNQTGAGTYTVVASSAAGCTRTMSGSAAVSINTNAGISSQPPNRSICENANTSFSVTASGTGPFTYQWQNNSAGSMANIAGATNSTYSISGATVAMSGWQYQVLVTGACGPVVNSNVVSLTVTANPVVSISASPVNGAICGTGSVTLNATGASSYSWSPGGATGASVSVSPLSTTTYTVTGTASGCSATASQAVTVYPAVTAMASASLSSLCQNQNSELTAAGGNSTNYSISSIAYSAPLGSGSQAVTGDDNVSSSIALPFTFSFYGVNYSNLYVYSNGFVQLGTSSSSTTVYGQTLPSGSNPNNIIAGVLSDLNASNNTITTFTTGVTPNRVFTIYYNNVQFYCSGSGGGCAGNKRGNVNFQIRLYEKSNIVEIHMNNLSNSSSTSGALKTMGIENATGTSAKVPAGRNGSDGNWTVSTPEAWRFTPNGGTLTYSWSPSTYLTNATSFNPTAQNMQLSQNYVVTVTDQNGCTATSAASVTVNPLPNVTITPGSATDFCAGGSVVLTASAGMSSYSWNTSPVQTTQSITVNTGTTFSVTGTNANGCSNVASQSIIVYDTLPASIVVIGSSNLCTGQTTTDLQAIQTNAVSYSWNTAALTDLITVSTSGSYAVSVTDIHGCIHNQQQLITETAPPAAPVVVAAGSTILCSDGITTNTVVLNATNYSSNLLWSTSETTTGITVDYADIFNVTYTDANGCYSVSNSIATTVKMYSTDPTAVVTNAANNSICPGGTGTVLSVQGGSLGDDADWKWYEGSCNGTAVASGNSYSVNPIVTTTYFVRAEGPCNNTNCVQVTVVVKTTSADPSTASSSAPILCGSGNSNLSVSGGTLGTGASWFWYEGGCGNGSPVGSGSTLNVTPSSTTTYFVRAEGDCNISNCAQATVTVKSLSVNPSTASPSAPILCGGGNSTLSVSGGSLGTNANWVWYEGGCGNGSSIGTGTSLPVSPSVTSVYYVRAEGDCNITNCASVTVIVKSLSVNPSTASPSAPILCGSGNSILSVSGGSLGTNANWVWYEGGCGNGSSIGTGTSLPVSPSVTSVYYVRAEGDCNITNCAQATITVKTFSTDPTLTTNNAVYNEICNGSPVQLTVNGGSLGSDADWVWYEGNCASGMPVANGSNVSVTPSGGGNHVYYVRAEGYCNITNCVSGSVFVRTAGPSSTVSTLSAPNSACSGNSGSLNINNVSNATYYSWNGPTGLLFNGNPGPYQTLTPNVSAIFGSLPGGSSGYSICVFAGNACGQSNTICKWVRGKVSTPGPVSGSNTGCPNASSVYSVAPVGGADTYTWTVVGNDATLNGTSMITATTVAPNVTVDFAAPFSGATLQVYASLNCGYNSTARSFAISRNPSLPGAISGNSYVCPSASAAYSVPAVNGATSYNWSCSVPGAIVTPSGNSANIFFPSTIPAGSSVCVTAISQCGYSSASRCKGIATGLPNTPSNITGPAVGQCGATGVSFSIPPVSSATAYSWSVSNGNATIVGPNNLSSITVDFSGNLNNVNITVSAGNNCGNSGTRSLSVIGKPGTPAAIAGNNSVCNGSVEIYTTGGSQGGNLLNWTVPNSASILGGQGTGTILVLWGSNGGQVKVNASNDCGNSANTMLAVSVTCRQSQLSNTLESNVKVYPNPAHDKIKVEISSLVSDRSSIELINTLGEIVYRTEMNIHEGTNLVELNLENMAKGFYNLSIQGASVNSQQRVVIE